MSPAEKYWWLKIRYTADKIAALEMESELPLVAKLQLKGLTAHKKVNHSMVPLSDLDGSCRLKIISIR